MNTAQKMKFSIMDFFRKCDHICNEKLFCAVEGYFIEADFQFPKKIYNPHMNLLFLSERMKINKTEKLATNLHDKKEYVADETTAFF